MPLFCYMPVSGGTFYGDVAFQSAKKLQMNYDALAAGQDYSVKFKNATPALVSSWVQNPGSLAFEGHAWDVDSATDRTVLGNIQWVVAPSDHPTGYFDFWGNIDGGAIAQFATAGPHVFSYTRAAHSAITASVEDQTVIWNLANTKTWKTGALALQREFVIAAPTYAFVGASTITDAALFYLAGPPYQGANCTITNSYELLIDAPLALATQALGIGLRNPTVSDVVNTVQRPGGIAFVGHARNTTGATDNAVNGYMQWVPVSGLTPYGNLEFWGNASGGAIAKVVSLSLVSAGISTFDGQVTATRINAPILNGTAGDINFYTAGTNRYHLDSTRFEPVANNTQYCGMFGSSWLAVIVGSYFYNQQVAITTGTMACEVFIEAAHTGITAGAENTSVKWDLSSTKTWATGALATQRFVRIDAPTIAFAGASVVTDAATVYIGGAPIAGAFATLTRSYALWVASGGVRIDTPVGLWFCVAADHTFDCSIDNNGGGVLSTHSYDATYFYQYGRLNWKMTYATAPTYYDLLPGDDCGQGIGASANRVKYLYMGGVLNNNQIASTAGAPKLLNFTEGAHTNITLSTEMNSVYFNLSSTKTWATGALATQRFFRIDAPTIAFAGASTCTTAALLYLSGDPIQGANCTLTHSYSFWTAGSVKVDGGQTSHRRPINDVGCSILATDFAVFYTAISVPRVAQLPTAASVGDGFTVVIGDASGSCAAGKEINITPNGAETINGVAALYALNASHNKITLMSDGVSNWEAY